MPRLLLIAALAVAATVVDIGAASASVSDDDRFCEPGEEDLSVLSEARFAEILRSVTKPALDYRCVARFGEQGDCQWNDTGAPNGPAGSWVPAPRDHWLPPAAAGHRADAARAAWLDDERVVLCDGYARGLDRPPRG